MGEVSLHSDKRVEGLGLMEKEPPRICAWCGQKERGDFSWESTIKSYLHDKCFNEIYDYALQMREMRTTVMKGMEAYWHEQGFDKKYPKSFDPH